MGNIFSQSLTWALLYTLWQGLLISGLLYVLLKTSGSASSRIRYNLSLGAFTLLFIWFVDTWISQYKQLRGAVIYVSAPHADAAGIQSLNTTRAITVASHENSILAQLLPGIAQYHSVIILLYTLGLAFMLFRFTINIMQVQALRNLDIALPSQHWNDFVADCRVKLAISRPVKVFLSGKVSAPVMLGALKPVILLPIATINHLTTEQVEAILLHELAHIRRHDYLINILQTVGETLLFFNPFVWLISAQVRKEREHCCDDLVVNASADPLPYARALAILETNRLENNLALAASGNKNQLFKRIKRIMEMKKTNLNNNQFTVILVAVLAVTFSVAMFSFTPSFGQKSKKEKQITNASDTATPKKVVKYKTIVIDDNGEVLTENISGPDDATTNQPGNTVIVKYINNSDSEQIGQERNYTKTFEYTTDSPGSKKIIKQVIVNTKDITKDVNDALASAHKELKDIDWEEITGDVEKELAKELAKIGDGETNKELLHDRHNEIRIIKKDLKNAEKDLKHAQVEIEIAHKEMDKAEKNMKNKKVMVTAIGTGDDEGNAYNTTSFDQMLDEMAADKIIDKSTVYVIRKANDELFINGKKQPSNVYNKYKHYLNFKTVDIKGKRGTLNIHIHN